LRKEQKINAKRKPKGSGGLDGEVPNPGFAKKAGEFQRSNRNKRPRLESIPCLFQTRSQEESFAGCDERGQGLQGLDFR
jgi:hypothetical protein